tara:strand:+ start:289 stop:498 length:210 start_codon:yes stop_codon:yes gene_type:complete
MDMLRMKIERYEKALEEIARSGDSGNPTYLSNLARVVLDGEPTTADRYNLGDDIEYNFVSPHDPGDETD